MSTACPDALPESWLVPDWPAPPGVHALCTSREGGVSRAPWGSLNLGDHVGDEPAAVRANRLRLQEAVRARTPGACTVFLQQVHGVDVAVLAPDSAQGRPFDACVTRDPGVVCTIMVADCLPVLLAHRSGAVVGAAHAGWRGLAGMPPGHGQPLAGGVIETLFARFAGEADAAGQGGEQVAGQTLAWLGPCIGPRHFEVGPEVREAFLSRDAEAARHFQPAHRPGKFLADLAQLARQRLAALGIMAVYGNDGSDGWCTVGNASRFFSHRRDGAALGASGRFAACIWRG
ncbi:Laccase domain protein yfiH [Delftia tsuruhatensis]|uniref:polyphenol oxidase family protein n=1 Tax=Delftia tsuruhatensis TaxID=180282 RepID=UPI001E6CE568|nr:laccase domain-containing protein [Delftia tsuruhatensis]CAB5707663.1 Laccase domain protein yfiH [Delftia tsuruhatensis]CAC9684983.1 Laccase domain protein yfiH [Delftia tsuruhatensis]